MMPTAKRASYFFSAPSIALPPAPEIAPAPKNLSARICLWHVMGAKKSPKIKAKNANILRYNILALFSVPPQGIEP